MAELPQWFVQACQCHDSEQHGPVKVMYFHHRLDLQYAVAHMYRTQFIEPPFYTIWDEKPAPVAAKPLSWDEKLDPEEKEEEKKKEEKKKEKDEEERKKEEKKKEEKKKEKDEEERKKDNKKGEGKGRWPQGQRQGVVTLKDDKKKDDKKKKETKADRADEKPAHTEQDTRSNFRLADRPFPWQPTNSTHSELPKQDTRSNFMLEDGPFPQQPSPHQATNSVFGGGESTTTQRKKSFLSGIQNSFNNFILQSFSGNKQPPAEIPDFPTYTGLPGDPTVTFGQGYKYALVTGIVTEFNPSGIWVVEDCYNDVEELDC